MGRRPATAVAIGRVKVIDGGRGGRLFGATDSEAREHEPLHLRRTGHSFGAHAGA